MSLNGKTIVFTGTLHMKRDDASLQAEKAGAKVSSTVTANTNILVCGSGVGAKKTDDAQKKGVEVWTEEQFTSALSGGSSASGSSSSSKKRKEPAPTAAKGRKKAVAPTVEEDDQPAAKKGKEVPASTSAATAASPDLLLTHVHQGKDRNEFMQDEVKRLKGTDPKLKHAAAFKLAAANWEAIVVAAAEAGAPPASPVATPHYTPLYPPLPHYTPLHPITSSKSSFRTGKDPAPPSSPPPSAGAQFSLVYLLYWYCTGTKVKILTRTEQSLRPKKRPRAHQVISLLSFLVLCLHFTGTFLRIQKYKY
jgi:hypothetical protein